MVGCVERVEKMQTKGHLLQNKKRKKGKEASPGPSVSQEIQHGGPFMGQLQGIREKEPRGRLYRVSHYCVEWATPKEAEKVVSLSLFEEEGDRHLQEIKDVFLGSQTGLYKFQRPLPFAKAASKQWEGAGVKMAREVTGLYGCPSILS